MLKIGDKVARIDNETNEVVGVFTFVSIHEWTGCARIENENDYYFIKYLDGLSSLNKKYSYELLTKDHEQRYQNFLHKQTVNEWFSNKQFSFEEKEAIYHACNVILATNKDRRLFFKTIESNREVNPHLKKAFKNMSKLFETND
jgi:hypothetical protein